MADAVEALGRHMHQEAPAGMRRQQSSLPSITVVFLF
jgi:hypothetical protein